jgi:hypothetical protein
MYTPSNPTNVGLIVVAASALTAAAGSLDAWVYMDHGQVFAQGPASSDCLLGRNIRFNRGGLAAAKPVAQAIHVDVDDWRRE